MKGFSIFHRVSMALGLGLIVGLFASGLVNLRPEPAAEQAETSSGPAAWFERLELWAYDVRMRFKASSSEARAEIIFVSVDDETLQGAGSRNHSWPWKRSVLSELLGELTRLGARAIVVDPVFIQPRTGRSEEAAFVGDIAGFKDVVFGFGFVDLIPELSTPADKFAFKAGVFPTRRELMIRAASLIQTPRDVFFYLEEASGGVALWRGGFPDKKSAEEAAAASESAEEAVSSVRELTAREMFSRVTRESVLQEMVTLNAPVVPGFSETFRSPALLSISFLTSGAHFGVSDLDPDLDGAVRKFRPVVQAEGRFYPSLALAVVQRLLPDEKVVVAAPHIFVGSRVFSLDSQGRALLRYYGEAGARRRADRPFPELSAMAIFNSAARNAEGRVTDQSLQKDIQDKVVFLAPLSPSLHASADTPVGAQSRSYVWAMALENLLRGGGMVRAETSFDGWLSLGMALLGALASALCLRILRPRRTLLYNLFIGACVLAGFHAYLDQAFDSGRWIAAVIPSAAYLAAGSLTTAVLTADGMRAVGRIWDALGRAVPFSMTERILSSPKLLTLKGAERELTLFVFDLLHFSSWSGSLSPEALVRLMREIWTGISDEISHAGGRFDSVVGDAALAYWGAPLENRRHALAACRCALAVRSLCDRRRKAWKSKYGVEIAGAMALAGGRLVVGDFGRGGSEPRMNYTILGRPLGEVRRLCALSERWGGRILMTETVRAAVAGQVESRCIGLFKSGGGGDEKAAPVHELLALKGGLPRARRSLLAQYEGAMALIRERRFAEAAAKLEEILKKDPGDTPSQILLARCVQCAEVPPPEKGWEGMFEVR